MLFAAGLKKNREGILTSNPSDSGLRSIPRLLGENASYVKVLPSGIVRRSLRRPRTGSLLCVIISSESCAATEGLNVDDASQPPLTSSSSESSSSEEDPKSSGNLNVYAETKI